MAYMDPMGYMKWKIKKCLKPPTRLPDDLPTPIGSWMMGGSLCSSTRWDRVEHLWQLAAMIDMIAMRL